MIGQNHIRLPLVDSTNSYLKLWLEKERLPEGTVVSAEFQTGGRGQRGTYWHSSHGANMLCSVLLYPNLQANKQFLLSKTVALALTDCLKKLVPEAEVKIKWPNDILLNGLKVAGVLIENSFSGEVATSSIIGVGLNINERNFPDELKATSLLLETGRAMPVQEVMREFFAFLQRRYNMLREGLFQSISQEYADNLFGMNAQRMYRDTATGEEFYGVIRGVSNEGILLLNTQERGYREYQLKEVVFL